MTRASKQAPAFPSPPPGGGRVAGLARWGWLAAFLLAIGLYLPTLRYGFTYDDNIIVELNPRIRVLEDPARYLATSWWDRPQGNREYRPLTMATFALNYALNGIKPAGFHAVNIVLHGLNAALVYWLVLALFGLPVAASVASLVFAFHPVHIEAVAGGVGRAELLMTFGFLTTLLAAQASRRASTATGRAGWAVAVFLFTALAVFSKEHGVMLLPVAALLALTPGRAGASPRSFRADVAKLGPAIAAMALAIAIYFVTRYAVLGALLIPKAAGVYRIDNPLVSWTGAPKLLALLSMLGRYGMLLFASFNPSPDYSMGVIDPVVHPGDPNGWLGLALVALVTWGIWRLRARPVPRFGLWFMLVTFAVASNVFLTIGTIMGERLLYLPSVGFCILLGGLLSTDETGPRRPGRWKLGLLALWTAALIFQHFRYLPMWRDSQTLLTYMSARVPGSVRAKCYRAMMLQRTGKPREALEAALETLRQAPEYAEAMATAGMSYAALGEDDKAIEMLERQRLINASDHQANRLLAELLTRKGRLRQAETVLREGAEADPQIELSDLPLGQLAPRPGPLARGDSLAQAGGAKVTGDRTPQRPAHACPLRAGAWRSGPSRGNSRTHGQGRP